MFLIAKTAKPPQVDLTLSDHPDDGPPKRTAATVGIRYLELLALSELNELNDLTPRSVRGGVPGGCGSGFASGG
jgi:hypothetical protein